MIGRRQKQRIEVPGTITDRPLRYSGENRDIQDRSHFTRRSERRICTLGGYRKSGAHEHGENQAKYADSKPVIRW